MAAKNGFYRYTSKKMFYFLDGWCSLNRSTYSVQAAEP